MSTDTNLRPLIAANWKMHGDMSWIEKIAEFDAIFPAPEREAMDVLICPPAVLIFAMMQRCDGKDIWLGAQNCHALESGAHTGDMSAEMLESVGADYVIIGHSERRALGETDADVKAKALACQRADLTPIICVGESLAQRASGQRSSGSRAQKSLDHRLTPLVGQFLEARRRRERLARLAERVELPQSPCSYVQKVPERS